MSYILLFEKIAELILAPIAILLFSISFLVFVWGIFILYAKDDVATGKSHLIWGVLGMSIIVGANAILSVIGNLSNSISNPF